MSLNFIVSYKMFNTKQYVRQEKINVEALHRYSLVLSFFSSYELFSH